MDLSWGMLAANRTGLPWPRPTGPNCPWPTESVDGVTCGYALRNFTELAAVFHEFGRIVRPGGASASSRCPSPTGACCARATASGSARWCRVIGGLLSDRAAYRYLPKSTAYLPSTEELRSMLAESGFSAVNRRALSGGLSQLITATRRGRP